jgi:hypothetical protein
VKSWLQADSRLKVEGISLSSTMVSPGATALISSTLRSAWDFQRAYFTIRVAHATTHLTISKDEHGSKSICRQDERAENVDIF